MMQYNEYLLFLQESNMAVLTINDYRSTYKRFFFTYDAMTEPHIRSFLAAVDAPSTKRKYRVQLKSLADFLDIKIDWKRKIPIAKLHGEAPLTVTEQHERKIIRFMVDRGEQFFADMVTFLLETGLRISELEGLAPDHYKRAESRTEDSAGRLHYQINHALQIDTRDMNTHSANGRYVPLSLTARTIMDKYGLPFNIDRRRFNDSLIAARTSLKLPDYKIHTFRKTFMSRSLKRGMDVVTIAAIMGHKQLSTMMDYADREMDTVCDAFNKAA
jgi:integrase